MVEEDQLGRAFLAQEAQLLALAGAEVRRLVETGALLREGGDDLEAERLGELAQLGERGLELEVLHAGELYRRHDGTLRHFFFEYTLGSHSVS